MFIIDGDVGPAFSIHIANSLDVGKGVLRGQLIEHILRGREDVVEVAALVVVECHVEERVAAFLAAPHESYLVEIGVCLAGIMEVFGILLGGESRCCCNLRAAEQSYSGRV